MVFYLIEDAASLMLACYNILNTKAGVTLQEKIIPEVFGIIRSDEDVSYGFFHFITGKTNKA